MQLLTPPPDRDHKVGRLEQREMLRHRLPCHIQVLAELAQGLAVARIEPIEQLPAARVGECFENLLHCLIV